MGELIAIVSFVISVVGAMAAVFISNRDKQTMPIRLTQVGVFVRDFQVLVCLHKNPCRSAILLWRQSSVHCRNPPLAKIAC